MTREERRTIHAAINALTHAEVAQIVKEEHPELRGSELDLAAKAAIAAAHELVSPKSD